MTTMKPIPFVEGWEFVQTLGEGAYGEVKLAVCQATMECVAVKIINLKNKEVEESVRKEVCIHKMLDHKNVIKFYGYRRGDEVEYLFLKYASGGELFDKIEPDEGMKVSEALRHFRNLIEGVQYLHSRGICHRDLKPENLLLDENDVLQITDFGMATIFRYQGQERELCRMCGTLPYTAPEVLKNQPYKAEPADVWSCGIILVALLAGELPWDAPRTSDCLYQNWKERQITTSPWNKIDTLALSLCRSVLVENPQRRYTLPQIIKHQFYNKSFPLQEEEDNTSSPSLANPSKRQRVDGFGRMPSPTCISSSQPETVHWSSNENSLSPNQEAGHLISFSQPVQVDDMLLNSQMQSTPGQSQTLFQKLVKRMTRFFVLTSQAETYAKMTAVLEALGYNVRRNTALMHLTVTTVDRRKSRLIFKACLMEMAGSLMVDFRLSKGDGLEFKRHFIRIKNKLKSIVRKTAPNVLSQPPGMPAIPATSSQSTSSSSVLSSASSTTTTPSVSTSDTKAASKTSTPYSSKTKEENKVNAPRCDERKKVDVSERKKKANAAKEREKKEEVVKKMDRENNNLVMDVRSKFRKSDTV